MNQIGAQAELVTQLPHIRRSADPLDDFLLGMSEAGKADYLVTGDKSSLLKLEHHHRTAILVARAFLDLLAR